MRALAAALLTVLVVSACRTSDQGTAIVQPGSPGQAPRRITAEAALAASGVTVTVADVSFMQRMIGHHAQALEMTALLPSRTKRADMRLLAQRIELSQADEITWMERWLEAHDQAVPDSHAYHTSQPPMPGMLTPDELSQLAAASGDNFDRLFLEYMIKHHEGALIMVSDLFMTEGAGQAPDIFAFASDVDADQRIEIDRMSTLLLELVK